MHLGLLDPADAFGREGWLALVPGTTRVEIEIGPGDGGFLAEAARARPETAWVGMEVRPSLVARARARTGLAPNACFLHLDGRWVVTHLLAAGSVDAFHVYFPDPWWKKRHHKRRLFVPEFCEGVRRALVPGGRLYLITDVAPRFAEIEEAMAAAGMVPEPWQREADAAGRSSYERKYLRQGREFLSMAFRKPEA